MSLYQCTAGVAVGSDLPIINLTGSAAIRILLKYLLVSFSGSPADVATLFMLERTTDAGTGGSALTETKTDPLTVTQTAAAVSGTFSAAPTDSDELLGFALNQRSVKEFYLPDGEEQISVASSANGLMLNSESSGGTPTCRATMKWRE